MKLVPPAPKAADRMPRHAVAPPPRKEAPAMDSFRFASAYELLQAMHAKNREARKK